MVPEMSFNYGPTCPSAWTIVFNLPYLGGFGNVVMLAVAFFINTVESKIEIVVEGDARVGRASPANAELSA